METFFFDLGIVVVLSAALSWVALYFRQPIITAYLVCGMIAGPWGLGLIKEMGFLDAVSRLGVTLLLFLAGIVLHPRRWIELFRETTVLTLATSAIFFAVTGIFALVSGFSLLDSAGVGLALMFSSTILVLKLLPTTTLHQQHMGATCIAVLIVQDLIAVLLLVLMHAAGVQDAVRLVLLPLKGLLLIAFALAFEQYVVRKLMARVDRFHETLHLLALAWCMGMALLSNKLGFSYEIGAFMAGVALARSPLSLFLSEGLKPFRDFFLVLFFFVLGARINFQVARAVILPSLLLTLILLMLKPAAFYRLFRMAGEKPGFSKEIGFRLNQGSEFSLIIAHVAVTLGVMSSEASHLVQLTTILTMIISCYLVVFTYPTPLGTLSRLKQD